MPFSDGLTVGLRDKLAATLGPEYKDKIIPAEDLALEYQELRIRKCFLSIAR